MIELTFIRNRDRYPSHRTNGTHGIYGPPRADGTHYSALCEVHDESIGRLLAAAPNMLAALRLARGTLSGVPDKAELEETLAAVRAAIAMADEPCPG